SPPAAWPRWSSPSAAAWTTMSRGSPWWASTSSTTATPSPASSAGLLLRRTVFDEGPARLLRGPMSRSAHVREGDLEAGALAAALELPEKLDPGSTHRGDGVHVDNRMAEPLQG